MTTFMVETIEPQIRRVEIETTVGDNTSVIEVTNPSFFSNIEISNQVAVLPSDFNSNIDARVFSIVDAGSGISISYDINQPSLTIANSREYANKSHNHIASDITDFNSSISGIIPLHSLQAGSGIQLNVSNKQFNISTTGLALSSHQHSYADIINFASGIDQEVSTLLVAGNYININYDTVADNLTINATGLQPSGNYSLIGHLHSSSDISNFNSSVSGLVNGIYAPLNNPSLIGVPTAPTASSGTSNNQIASTQFVRNEISNLVNAAPTALDTLNELAIALGNDANFSTTVTNSLAQKANISGTSFTGSVTAPSGNFTVLQQNGVTVSVNGHTHNVSSITDFNSSISGLLPVTNITGGTNISVVPNGTNFTVSVSGQLGLTAEEVDDRVNSLLVPGTGIVLSYNDNANTLTISTSGLQPSGNYSLIGHSHTSSDITNFNSSVSGLLPVKNVIGSGYVNVSSTSGNYTVSVSGLQPSGNYANAVHTHTSSDITNFNSSVSGLLPLTNIVGGTNISVVPSGTVYTVSVSGSLGLTTEEVDDRVSNLLVAGSGINLNYNDNANTLTINNTSISPDEIEEYATTSNFPASGNANVLYVATNTGQLFKWDDSVYYEAGPQGASTGTHGTQHDSDGVDPIPLTEYNVPQFTSNTNNLNHLNRDILYITADANNRELTGLLAPAFCCVKLLVNISSTNTIIIDNQSTNSDPANRFLIYTGSDYYLLPGQSLSVVYSTDAMRWRVL
jgi:hypothetical protein